MSNWNGLRELIRQEVTQRREEGCDVTGYAERVEKAEANEAELMGVYADLMALESTADFKYCEPSGLEEIRSVRPHGPRELHCDLSDQQWMNKFYGAWLGRSAGCALGKPLETHVFMHGSHGRAGWHNIKLWFEGAGQWPISHYTPSESQAREQYGIAINSWFGTASCSGHISYMETDDDIRYTVLGLLLLEERGLAFDAWDVGKHWLRHLPFGQVFTAEAQAYMNFSRVLSHMHNDKPHDWERHIEWVRTYLNPYREWIGAQIRVDGYAYGAAGNPQLAAELAWRDASLSHVKNGIYGAMFCSAMIAAAFAESDVKRIVEIGLSEIPKQSRLAEDIALAVRIAESTDDQVELVDRVWQAFKHYHPVHTNNNAALCAAALIHSGGDFEKGITTAVLGGWDTDCNGATVGSILGAVNGANALPASWIAPLNDTLYAEISGFHPIAISECARRSYEVFRKLHFPERERR
ncbi:ADP-ribosylglycohydrolase family protein [Paenibacillus sp. J5C_2022]|uniref:ADP-ribosylglycohydrolase family protein n=1 Tax=Paenibacillus sp. J5C2022 TaxID=2977129 RepID=UPI0021CE3056|nr:ADP-ribosylglycohydrolase family protein [Paenibacillus sp. J5C2022]MCU6707385.1 ADP-ribosylglycohydrolase family protein [Paenibacillus sp. J5C2022]